MASKMPVVQALTTGGATAAHAHAVMCTARPSRPHAHLRMRRWRNFSAATNPGAGQQLGEQLAVQEPPTSHMALHTSLYVQLTPGPSAEVKRVQSP